MSYDITTESRSVNWNYTSNIRPMLISVGIHLQKMSGLTAKEFGRIVVEGIAQLKRTPDVFRDLNPSNGWGDYDSLLIALETLVMALVACPDEIVSVSF